MKKNKAHYKGLTLIELLLVICIIGILTSIILSSIVYSRQKSRDLSTFSSMRSAAGPAFACLNSNLTGVELASMDSSIGSICKYGMNKVDGYPNWPDISKNGWSNQYQTNIDSDGFFWCPVKYTLSNHPTSVGSYGGTYGGSADGSFCYMLKNGDRYMWCTENGCRKEGF